MGVRHGRLALAACAALTAVIVACTGPSGSGRSGAPVARATTSVPRESVPAPATTGASAATLPPGAARDGLPHFAVGSLVRDFVDLVRHRTLRTIVYFPAVGPPLQAGAAPAPGGFPLVLMAHGYRLPPSGYERILDRIAADGYLVAAPAFPHTSPTGDGDRRDIVNQPADLSFVVDSVVRLADQSPALLPRVSDPARVGALGHSDGGLTVSAWAYNATFRDSRVACVVGMAGGIGLFPGTYFSAGSPPLLAMHGTADETNPYSASVNLFNAVPSGTPRYLLTIDGGTHLGPYMFDTALPELGQVIVDFLDAYLAGDPQAMPRLSSDGNRPGLIALRSG